MSKELILSQKQIENRIFTIRNKQVMMDRDLAEMYQVETRVLNQAVKRNIGRFPESFRFQLTEDETNELVTNSDRFGFLKSQNQISDSRSQNVTLNKSHSKRGQNIKYLPYAFTEQGVAMLSAVHIHLLTKTISKQQKLDVQKANEQYGNFVMKSFSLSHDRFLIVDGKEVYHLGASLKDLGKKWFAFSKMETKSVENIINSITKLI